MKRQIAVALAAASMFAAGCAGSQTMAAKHAEPVFHQTAHNDGIPGPMREWRAAWVATVANIDWPSKAGLSTEQQKAEIITILDAMQAANMNACVMQVRPQCDAMYASEIEPWSSYLTGVQGQAPSPFYDPLEFWVEESHKRGIELHCWFNPYRANHSANDSISDKSIVKANPEMVVKLGNDGYYWMDPAREDVKQRSIDVVMDVVKRYDVDGIHFDDYFYPYPSYNDNMDFPDDASWAAYQASGGKLSRGDWRRAAVDDFIQRLYVAIKAEKPHVKFGMSPFGIWRPGNPPGIAGFDQHNQLFADAKKWLNEGWVDYYTPQLYWPTWRPEQSFPVLLGWWRDQNWHGRNLWPGMSISDVRNEDPAIAKRNVEDTFNEVMITRGIEQTAPGHCFFSVKYLVRNDGGIVDRFVKGDGTYAGPYAKKALIPPSPWLDDKAPEAPRAAATRQGNDLQIAWTPTPGAEDAFMWVAYYEQGGNWSYEVLPAPARTFNVQTAGTVTRTVTSNQGLDVKTVEEPAKPVTRIAVSAVDRVGNESKRTVVEVK